MKEKNIIKFIHSRPQNRAIYGADGAWPLSIPPKEPRASDGVGSIKQDGQSIVEYAIMLAAVVTVMVVAINGPIRDSLNSTFGGVIRKVGESINALVP